jgi:hypothetical protein
MNLISGKGETSSRLPAFSLFLPGSCPNYRDRRSRSVSAGLEEGEHLPEDLETSDRYIAVPHKNDLGLGQRLALAFVDQELSDEYDTVAGFFGRRGAYGRFKALLHAHGMLERWYEFENGAMEEALLAWCEENGIQPVDG